VDANELQKMGGMIDIGINCTADDFLTEIRKLGEELFPSIELGWTSWCKFLKEKGFDRRPDNRETINSFDVNGHLERHLLSGDTVVTDMGTSFTCTHQDLSVVRGVKLFTSSGVAAMGFGLPGAIGCSHAKPDRSSRTLLITGDGGLMFNIQELQSIVSYNLNIRILVYENGGYLTMKHMQEARFQRLVGSEKSSRLECPDFVKVASAFGIVSNEVHKPAETESAIKWLLDTELGPKLLVVHIDPWQLLVPRVQTRSDENGRLIPPSLDQMFPQLNSNDESELNNAFCRFLA
jgi:acetolactate synthase-1/2/3 large subunit